MKMFYEAMMGNLSAEEMTEKARIREIVEYDRYCTDLDTKFSRRNCTMKALNGSGWSEII